MKIDLSDQSIDALAEIISGGSANTIDGPIGLYRQGWKIEQFMQGLGVPFTLGGNTRVQATRAALHKERSRPDAHSLLRRIVERAADPRDFAQEPERFEGVLNYLNKHLIFDGLKIVKEGIKVRLTSTSTDVTVADAFSAMVESINYDTVKRDLERALRSAEEDPEDAVTAACSVVESVCRSILIELSVPLPAKKDVQHLYQAVREPLGLAPDKAGVADLIASDVRTILGGLNTVVAGIGALRTHGGDAHGRERGFKRIDPRIAKLSINAASSIAMFLLETWQRKFPTKVLHAHRESTILRH